MPASREPALRPDEIRTLRAMMVDYRTDRAVSQWLGSKWRAAVIVVSGVSAIAVLFGSVLEIVRLWP